MNSTESSQQLLRDRQSHLLARREELLSHPVSRWRSAELKRIRSQLKTIDITLSPTGRCRAERKRLCRKDNKKNKNTTIAMDGTPPTTPAPLAQPWQPSPRPMPLVDQLRSNMTPAREQLVAEQYQNDVNSALLHDTFTAMSATLAGSFDNLTRSVLASTPGRGRICRQLDLESITEEAEYDQLDQLAQLEDLDNRLQALRTPEADKKKPVAMPVAMETPEGDKKPAATETPKAVAMPAATETPKAVAMKAQLDEWKALDATSLASPFASLPSDTGLQSPFERLPGKKRRLMEAPTPPTELRAERRPGKKRREAPAEIYDDCEAPAEPPRRRKSRRILNKKQK